MDKMTLISLISDWQKVILTTKGISRECEEELYKASGSKPMKIVTGFRRSGKSFLVQRVAKRLIEEEEYTLQNVLYLNFEDYLLDDIRTMKDLGEAVQLFLTEVAGNGKKLIILDEIQEIPRWDKVVRTIYEKERNVEIFLTGSNSELLSSELGTNLAGRFVEIEVLPFNFKEFLDFKTIHIDNEIDFFRELSTIKPLFTEYLTFGGLPEIFMIEDKKTKQSYLRGIISKVVLDDIVRRFNIRQVDIVEDILHFLLAGVGNTVSYTRVANFIRMHGRSIKNDTVIEYISYIQKTFAVLSVDRFDWKLHRVFSVNAKYYAVDTGLVNLYGNLTNSYARQLENIVLLKLREKSSHLFYGLKDGKEVDFIVKESDGSFKKYQITKSLSQENRDRELSPFVLTDNYLSQGNNILLTMDTTEETLEYNGVVIKKKYLLKWLLDI